MKKKQFGDYYLGLDIGTDSVGWAVTDPQYEVLRFNGKAMWGIHLFNAGNTAEDRRAYRITRRRLERRHKRLSLLRELFDLPISSVDPTFFARLDESNLLSRDKLSGQKNSLFNDKEFTDKDYHRKYPTIYHLRYDMIKTDEKPDIRLVYLALAHAIKHRGHFLYDTTDEDLPPFKDLFANLQKELEDLELIDCALIDTVPKVEGAMCNVRGVRLKKDALKPLLSAMSDSDETHEPVGEIVNALSGGKFSLTKLFGSDYESALEPTQFAKNHSLSEPVFEVEHDALEAAIGEERCEVIDDLRAICDWAKLKNILNGSFYISEAKKKQYKQHHDDLQLLKAMLRATDDMPLFDKIMRSGEKGAYPSYVGNMKNVKGTIPDRCTQEEFCNYLSEALEEKWDIITAHQSMAGLGNAIDEMKTRLEDKTFMPLQSSKDNGVLPNSVHRKEVRAIVDNASRFYPFLRVKDTDGTTVADKVVKLCTFRMPYYVGPVGSNKESGFKGWAVRRTGMENDRILPWNLENVIDVDATSEKFIANLVSMCTYIRGEPVLPKNSILFCRFKLYNELNNISINGVRITPELKSKLVSEFFEGTTRRVTVNDIRSFIKRETGVADAEVTGLDRFIKSSLESENKLREILGQKYNTDLSESIIHTVTVFGDDHSRLKKKLSHDLGDQLPENTISKLSNLKFRDWGSVSRKLLVGVRSNISGHEMSIIEALRDTNHNLQELLSSDYDFTNEIDTINSDDEGSEYNVVEKMRASPAVKHAMHRCSAVIDDIVCVTGHPPTKIFVETTREHADTGRTVSRKNELIARYKNMTANEDAKALLSSLDGKSDADLRRKKLFSYYSQLGKCMYCGCTLSLEDLDNKEQCDMDHIYPQSLLTDDSLRNNMVLTCRKCNSDKGNRMISPETQHNMHSFWKMLRDSDLITAEKYSRLTRTIPFSDSDKAGFINRQLVETSQTVKCTAEMLKAKFAGKTDVVYVKGSNVSQFRQDQSDGKPFYLKCRNINDHHHAKDAYLNIVVGNVYDVKFTKNFMNFIRSGEHYNLNKMFDCDVSRCGVNAWKAGIDGSIKTVDKWMRRDNILYTRATYTSTGELFDLNIVKKGNGQLPVKANLPIEDYGGYNKLRGAYFALFEHDDRKDKARTLIRIPRIMLSGDNSREELTKYAESQGLVNPDLRLARINVDSTLKIDGFCVSLRGTRDEGSRIIYLCGVQLVVPFELIKTFKAVFKYADKTNGSKTKKYSASDLGLTEEDAVAAYDLLTKKAESKPYSDLSHFTTVANDLKNYRQKYTELDLDGKAKLLSELLKMYHCDAERTNLSSIGGKKTIRVELSSKISKFESVLLVNRSPSGLFENTIDLQKI